MEKCYFSLHFHSDSKDQRYKISQIKFGFHFQRAVRISLYDCSVSLIQVFDNLEMTI